MFSLNMVDYPMFSLLLSTWIFEQVEGAILSHFYSLSFLVRGLLQALKLGVGGWVAYEILVTSPEAKFLFPFLGPGLWIGTWPGLVNTLCFA